MLTYQEKIFLKLIDKYNKEQLSKVQKLEKNFNQWKNNFLIEFPRDSITSIEINDFLISSKKTNSSSFCRRICYGLKEIFHINMGTKTWANTFGLAIKYGEKIELSENLKYRFNSDYKQAYIYILSEIASLLKAVDNNDYIGVEECKLPQILKHILLIIYSSDKLLPVLNDLLLVRYHERIGLSYCSDKKYIYMNRHLIEWKEDVPEIAGWDNYIFLGFCDWLYRKSYSIDGNLLRKSARNIFDFRDEQDIQGETKEGVTKQRVNQNIFRKRLLQYYKKCCLCGLSNTDLLVASHIKPWSVCKTEEKLDINNGFLMCPNHDKLFDQGWITFNDEGKIIISDELSENDRILLNIHAGMTLSLTAKNKDYLQYHRKEIFKMF